MIDELISVLKISLSLCFKNKGNLSDICKPLNMCVIWFNSAQPNRSVLPGSVFLLNTYA